MSDTLAAVLRADVDWAALPPKTPPSVRPPSAPLPRPRSEPALARHRRGPDRDRSDRLRRTRGGRRRSAPTAQARRSADHIRGCARRRGGGGCRGLLARLAHCTACRGRAGDRVLDLGSRSPQPGPFARWPAARLRRRPEARPPRPGRPGAARDLGRSGSPSRRLVACRRRAGGRDRGAAMARSDRRGRAPAHLRTAEAGRRPSRDEPSRGPGCGTTRSCSAPGAEGSTRSRPRGANRSS